MNPPALPSPAPRLVVRQAAVLGAGVMGAQIAAHLVNAGVRVVLFDLPAKDGDANAIARKGVAGLAKLEPAPLGAPISPHRSRSPTTRTTCRGCATATS